MQQAVVLPAEQPVLQAATAEQPAAAPSAPTEAEGEARPAAPELNPLLDISSLAEMEALGADRLKAHLQQRGLKCGGTVGERAARLFQLKTTPLDRLDTKHFARKPSKGGK